MVEVEAEGAVVEAEGARDKYLYSPKYLLIDLRNYEKRACDDGDYGSSDVCFVCSTCFVFEFN